PPSRRVHLSPGIGENCEYAKLLRTHLVAGQLPLVHSRGAIHTQCCQGKSCRASDRSQSRREDHVKTRGIFPQSTAALRETTLPKDQERSSPLAALWHRSRGQTSSVLGRSVTVHDLGRPRLLFPEDCAQRAHRRLAV